VRYDAAISWPGIANSLVEYRPLLRDGAGELGGTITRRFRVFCVTPDTQFIAPPALARKVKQTLVANIRTSLASLVTKSYERYATTNGMGPAGIT